MTKTLLHIYVRVILRRVRGGEDLEEVLNSYTALTEEDKEEIRFLIKIY